MCCCSIYILKLLNRAPIYTSVGTYQDGNLCVWSSHDYSLLVSTTLQSPVHAVAWDPHVAYEFTTVGGGGRGGSKVSYWMVEETKGGKEFNLKVKVQFCHPG